MESAMPPLVSRRWNLRIASVVRTTIYLGACRSRIAAVQTQSNECDLRRPTASQSKETPLTSL